MSGIDTKSLTIGSLYKKNLERSAKMNELEVQEVKQIQKEILDVVIDFCNKNRIKYFFCGGTLIGAVRHKGYIPWDDDIDIALLRKDYEKFINNFNSYNDLYKVYEPQNTDWYPYPFAKVTFVKSIIKEATDSMIHDIGINIDIFPIDNVSEKKEDQKKLVKAIRRKRNVLDIKTIKINKKRAFYKNLILFIGKFIFKHKAPNDIALDIEHLATKYISCKTSKAGVIVWGYGECEIVSKKIFADTINLEFEGDKYSVPIGYHEWLSSIYGDYMELPPPEQRVSHHDFKAYVTD
ncbi:MAG: LicD family protein [Xylanivirga thermophila]|jgi:lipopolysaccharide cholinephosphotransferase|uniref:LicD family protein n=1 Tax=Xylanivirga thermophila TaxID=2496273 RepID=UPI0039F51FC9